MDVQVQEHVIRIAVVAPRALIDELTDGGTPAPTASDPASGPALGLDDGTELVTRAHADDPAIDATVVAASAPDSDAVDGMTVVMTEGQVVSEETLDAPPERPSEAMTEVDPMLDDTVAVPPLAAATPVVGDLIKKIALGGNDYGNLTLTRFYALHTLIVPAVVIGAVAAHVALARRHGPTQLGARTRVVPRWPDQTVRTAIACAAVLAILLAYVVRAHGGELGAPADPAQAFDARPLWYFRWLFELRELAGSAEKLAAMAAPAVVGGALVMLPLLDRGEARAPRARLLYLGALAGLLALIGGLTAMSFLSDAGNGELTKRQAKADERAQLARALAKDYGVPATGALDVFWASPMARGRALYAARCKGCHDADSKDRKGPIIAAGHGGRAWLKALIREPSGDAFWGRTKLAKAEGAMKAFDQMSAAELDAVVELMYAETGAADIAQAKLAQGAQVFETACSDCHARDEGAPGASAPGLAGLGTRAYYLSFISNPKSAFHMGKDKSQMPRFDRELSLAERDAQARSAGVMRSSGGG